jgi:hypothetical protein
VHVLIKTLSGQPILSHSGYVSNYNNYELPINDSAKLANGVYWIEVRTDAGKLSVISNFGF